MAALLIYHSQYQYFKHWTCAMLPSFLSRAVVAVVDGQRDGVVLLIFSVSVYAYHHHGGSCL